MFAGSAISIFVYWQPTVLRHYLAGIQYAVPGDLPADATPSAGGGQPVRPARLAPVQRLKPRRFPAPTRAAAG